MSRSDQYNWQTIKSFCESRYVGWCWIVKVRGPKMAYFNGKVFSAFESSKFGIDTEAVTWVMPVPEPHWPEQSDD
jgi:hypothetical protein